MINLDDESILRRFQGEERPSLVEECAALSIEERLDLFLELRARVVRQRYGCEPPFERVARVIRLDEK